MLIKSYDDWYKENCDVEFETIKVNRNTSRTVYNICGITICEDYISPWNVFEKPRTFTSITGLQLPINEKYNNIIKKYNGYLSDQYYTEDGIGTPCFSDSDTNNNNKLYSFELAYNFLREYISDKMGRWNKND